MKKAVILIIALGSFLTTMATDSISNTAILPKVEAALAYAGKEKPTALSAKAQEAYLWISSMQLANGLVESAEKTNFVSLYDNALSALVFMSQGDIEKAERIFDFFNSRIESELLKDAGGFYQFRAADGNNGSSTWLGDNAWLLLALNHYEKITGKDTYQRLSAELEAWIRSLQDTDGGLWGGFRENGNRIPKITEGIITAFNAVPGYDNFHQGILEFLKAERFDTKAGAFVAQPDYPKYNFAMDLYSLGFLIMEDMPEAVLFGADKFLNTQTSTINGTAIEGYCFDEDKDVVWMEGTAQMALAFRTGGHMGESEEILNTLKKSFVPSTLLKDVQAIPYTVNYGTNFESSLLWDHSDKTPAVSPNAWFLFAEAGFNPFAMGRQKEIPQEMKFWSSLAID